MGDVARAHLYILMVTALCPVGLRWALCQLVQVLASLNVHHIVPSPLQVVPCLSSCLRPAQTWGDAEQLAFRVMLPGTLTSDVQFLAPCGGLGYKAVSSMLLLCCEPCSSDGSSIKNIRSHMLGCLCKL